MDNSNYRLTGNNIPINEALVMAHVKGQLDEYQKAINSSVKPTFDPLNNPIIYTTPEGKTIQVPQQIQTKAIQEWQQSKNTDGLVVGYEPLDQHTDINDNTNLGLHNQDSKFESSIRPFNRFDSMNMPNSSQMLDDRTFALDGQQQQVAQQQQQVVPQQHQQVVPQQHQQVVPTEYPQQLTPRPPIRYTNTDIIEREVKQNNNNIYYIILLIFVIIGGFYLLKHK